MTEMYELNDIEKKVLGEIKPKHEEYELVWSSYREIARIVSNVLREHGIHAEITLQGSIAHDTWLSGDRDLDIFVLFPGDWTREDLEKKALPLLIESCRKIGSCELRYAEHPYVRVWYNGVEADIVPGLKLDDPSLAKTAVDRTPFHTKYINSKLTEEQRDHVRLLKKFMKTLEIYGAEVRVHGFSGYAIELLIATYTSFKRVLEEVSKWKIPVFVNTLGEKFNSELKRALVSRYPSSCIYMPDPVDPLRNVTASVNIRSLSIFMLASKCYISNPGLEFFEQPTPLSIIELEEAISGRCIVFLTYELREPLPPDVIWGEASRVASRIARFLSVFNIGVIDYSTWTNEKDVAVMGLELENCYYSKYRHYSGPCIGDANERLFNYIRKHHGRGHGPWIDNSGCLNSLDIRKYTSVLELLDEKWSSYSVSPHLKSIKPIIEYASRSVLEKIASKGGLKWLSSFISKTPPWMAKCIS